MGEMYESFQVYRRKLPRKLWVKLGLEPRLLYETQAFFISAFSHGW